MTANAETENAAAASVPARGLFGRPIAKPVTLDTSGTRQNDARALFGRKRAEAA